MFCDDCYEWNRTQTFPIVCNYSFFVGPPIPESTTVYEEIHDYEELKQDKQEKRYENNEIVDKIYVSLKPVVMERIRDHI